MQLLNEKETAQKLAVSQETLRSWRKRGQGPEFVKVGRAVRYRLDALEEFVEAGSVKPRDRGEGADDG